MRKIYSLLIAFFAIAMFNSQAVLTVIQTTPTSSIYTVTYNDATNNWAFYNPGSGYPSIGMYLWLNGADNSTGSPYFDSFSNIPTKLTWDGSNYVGTIDLNTHNFNVVGGVLSVGTKITEMHFVLTEYSAGNNAHKTGDLLASNFEFTSTIIAAPLGVIDINSTNFKSFVSDGKLYTPKKGNLDIQILDFSGRVVKTMNVKSSNNGIELNLAKKGSYILKVNNEVVKFIY